MTICGLAVSAAHANLVVNGSFESTAIGNNTYLTVTPGTAAVNLPGWTVSGTSVDMVSGPTRYPAYDGNQSIDLAGTPGPGGVEQMITTVVGEWYVIDFALGENHEGTGNKAVDFTFGSHSETLVGAVGQGNWLAFQRTIQATSTSTLLSFTSPNQNFFGGLVDAVSVQAVPEPATMLGLATAFGWALRRRKRN